MEIKQEGMAAVPEFLTKLNVNYLLGIAKVDNNLVLLLNSEAINKLV